MPTGNPGAPGSRARVVTFANQKGGSGKSLAAYFFANILAERGDRILLVDCDGQEGNVSGDFGADKSDATRSLCALVTSALDRGALTLVDCVQHVGRIDVLAGTTDLAALDVRLSAPGTIGSERLLACQLEPALASYDWVLIDTPGDFCQLSLNALVASDEVVIPCRAVMNSVTGAKVIMEAVAATRDVYNPRLRVAGVFLNAFNRQSKVHREVAPMVKALCEQEGVPLMDTRVCNSVTADRATTFALEPSELVSGTVRRGLVRDMYDLVEEFCAIDARLRVTGGA